MAGERRLGPEDDSPGKRRSLRPAVFPLSVVRVSLYPSGDQRVAGEGGDRAVPRAVGGVAADRGAGGRRRLREAREGDAPAGFVFRRRPGCGSTAAGIAADLPRDVFLRKAARSCDVKLRCDGGQDGRTTRRGAPGARGTDLLPS